MAVRASSRSHTDHGSWEELSVVLSENIRQTVSSRGTERRVSEMSLRTRRSARNLWGTQGQHTASSLVTGGHGYSIEWHGDVLATGPREGGHAGILPDTFAFRDAPTAHACAV